MVLSCVTDTIRYRPTDNNVSHGAKADRKHHETQSDTAQSNLQIT
jgi:hypothetical protein